MDSLQSSLQTSIDRLQISNFLEVKSAHALSLLLSSIQWIIILSICSKLESDKTLKSPNQGLCYIPKLGIKNNPTRQQLGMTATTITAALLSLLSLIFPTAFFFY